MLYASHTGLPLHDRLESRLCYATQAASERVRCASLVQGMARQCVLSLLRKTVQPKPVPVRSEVLTVVTVVTILLSCGI
jgi:hypothetical protein